MKKLVRNSLKLEKKTNNNNIFSNIKKSILTKKFNKIKLFSSNKASLDLEIDKFETLFQMHSAIMLLINPNTGAIINANNSAIKFYKYSKKQLLSMNIADINQLSNDQIIAKYHKAATLKCNYFIFPHKLANGEIRTVEVYSTPIAIIGEQILFSIINDITYKKKLEDEALAIQRKLEEKDREISVITNNLPGFIAYVNIQTLKYEWVNIAYQKSFGLSINKIIGHHIKTVIGKTAYNSALTYINEVKKGKKISYENIFNLKEGKRWLKVNYVPCFDSDRKVTSMIVLSYDITEQKIMEEKLIKSKEILQSKIEDLEKFQKIAINRELKMIELKEKIRELEK